MQRVCARDRPFPTGRSRCLVAYPSWHVRLGGGPWVVGHNEQDFDTGSPLSGLYLYDGKPPPASLLNRMTPFTVWTQDVEESGSLSE